MGHSSGCAVRIPPFALILANMAGANSIKSRLSKPGAVGSRAAHASQAPQNVTGILHRLDSLFLQQLWICDGWIDTSGSAAKRISV
jgi:hypothetical protein